MTTYSQSGMELKLNINRYYKQLSLRKLILVLTQIFDCFLCYVYAASHNQRGKRSQRYSTSRTLSREFSGGNYVGWGSWRWCPEIFPDASLDFDGSSCAATPILFTTALLAWYFIPSLRSLLLLLLLFLYVFFPLTFIILPYLNLA